MGMLLMKTWGCCDTEHPDVFMHNIPMFLNAENQSFTAHSIDS